MPNPTAFESPEEFDRAAKAIRWAEEQRRSGSPQVFVPGPAGAGVVVVRVRGERYDSAIFGPDEPSEEDKKGPYPGRFMYRNLLAKNKEDEWLYGAECLITALNYEDLGVGCRYEGFVTDDVAEEDRNSLDFKPVVLVPNKIEEVCDCLEEFGIVMDSPEFPDGAAPEFDFAVYDDARGEGVTSAPAYQFLFGTDWVLRHRSLSVWRTDSEPAWNLSYTGGVWTLTGKGLKTSEGGSNETVTYVSAGSFDGFDGGDFNFRSSTTDWKGPSTITLKGFYPPTPSKRCGPIYVFVIANNPAQPGYNPEWDNASVRLAKRMERKSPPDGDYPWEETVPLEEYFVDNYVYPDIPFGQWGTGQLLRLTHCSRTVTLTDPDTEELVEHQVWLGEPIYNADAGGVFVFRHSTDATSDGPTGVYGYSQAGFVAVGGQLIPGNKTFVSLVGFEGRIGGLGIDSPYNSPNYQAGTWDLRYAYLHTLYQVVDDSSSGLEIPGTSGFPPGLSPPVVRRSRLWLRNNDGAGGAFVCSEGGYFEVWTDTGGYIGVNKIRLGISGCYAVIGSDGFTYDGAWATVSGLTFKGGIYTGGTVTGFVTPGGNTTFTGTNSFNGSTAFNGGTTFTQPNTTTPGITLNGANSATSPTFQATGGVSQTGSFMTFTQATGQTGPWMTFYEAGTFNVVATITTAGHFTGTVAGGTF